MYRRKYPRDSDGEESFYHSGGKSLDYILAVFIVYLLLNSFYSIFMLLFLPLLPHLHHYNPSSFLSSYPISPSAVKAPKCASNYCREASALCCPWHCPGQPALLAHFNSRQWLFHHTGCRIFSNNPEKERRDVNKWNIYKGGKWCCSHAITAVPEFQLQGWVPIHFLTVVFSMSVLIIP